MLGAYFIRYIFSSCCPYFCFISQFLEITNINFHKMGLVQNFQVFPLDMYSIQYSVCTMHYIFFSGRTEYQTASTNRARRSVKFERTASKRYSRRPTFEKREREEAMKRQEERRRKEREAKAQ